MARLVNPFGPAAQSPPVGTEVVVAFEAGEPTLPYVLGTASAAPVPMGEQEWVLASGHRLAVDDAARQVRLTDDSGTEVILGPGGALSVTTNAPLDVHTPTVNVHSAQVAVDGIVTCTTLIASSGVISPSYTPGAGNIF